MDDPDPMHPRPAAGPRLWPRVVGVLILLVGVGGTFLWFNPDLIGRGTADPAAIAALQARVARLEQRPDTAALGARLDALERARPAPSAAVAQAAPAEDQSLAARVKALEARVTANPAASTATSAAPAPGTATDLGPVLARLDVMEKAAAERGDARGEVDAARQDTAALRARLDAIDRQIAAREAASTGASDRATASLSDRTATLARLEAASAALAAGEKLGAIPNAPPGLARYANTPPPTEASLRLAWPAAMHAALAVSVPDTEGKPFAERMLARLRDYRLITVREGDRIVVGNPVVGTLEHVQTLLNAGDLAGAVRTAGSVAGPPAAALADWLGDARALLAARTALEQALTAVAGNG